MKKKAMKKMKSLSSMLGATNRRSSTASFGSVGGASVSYNIQHTLDIDLCDLFLIPFDNKK